MNPIDDNPLAHTENPYSNGDLLSEEEESLAIPFPHPPEGMPEYVRDLTRVRKKRGITEAMASLTDGEDLPSQLLDQQNRRNQKDKNWDQLRTPPGWRATAPLRPVELTVEKCYPELNFTVAKDNEGHRYAITSNSSVRIAPEAGQKLAAQVRNAFVAEAEPKIESV
jgi:hypothetical protein